MRSCFRDRLGLVSNMFHLLVVCMFFSNMCMLSSHAIAQSNLNMPPPGEMITPSISYNPIIVAGISIYPDDPLQIDFIIDKGDDNLEGKAFNNEVNKLINYFFAALTVPEDEMWVNLSPYEKNRVIANGLGNTEIGRDMLIQDYMLKQLTASLMYPEEEVGAKFWKNVYEKTAAKFGVTEIPTNTFNKIWIVPDVASIYVNGTNVFVSDSHLKVMLEEDYLAMESNIGSSKHGLGDIKQNDLEQLSEETKEAIREIIIPEIEREVNEGENFANLRQIYNSMILATWYKKNLRESVLGSVYMDLNKISGIDLENKQVKEKIYNQYVEAFKVGVYDYVREEYDPTTQAINHRKYFSGGLKGPDKAMIVSHKNIAGLLEKLNSTVIVRTIADMLTRGKPAESAEERRKAIKATEQATINRVSEAMSQVLSAAGEAERTSFSLEMGDTSTRGRPWRAIRVKSKSANNFSLIAIARGDRLVMKL